MTKDDKTYVREARAIGQYKLVLERLMDAALTGKAIKGGYDHRWSRRSNQKTPILVSLYVENEMIWRAMNSAAHSFVYIDAPTARLDLRDYLYLRDRVRQKAMDNAEKIDE